MTTKTAGEYAKIMAELESDDLCADYEIIIQQAMDEAARVEREKCILVCDGIKNICESEDRIDLSCRIFAVSAAQMCSDGIKALGETE